VFSSPLQTIREDFGTARVDHIFSQKDTLGAIYTVDDGNDFTGTPLNPFSADVLTLREQVLSLEETHVFSASLLNNIRFGFSRAAYFFSGEPTRERRQRTCRDFARTARRRGGGGRKRGVESGRDAGFGGKQQRQQPSHRAEFIYVREPADVDAWRHQWSFGVWLQKFSRTKRLR